MTTQHRDRTHDAVRAILSISDPATRDLAVENFLRDRRQTHLVMARTLLRKYGANPARFLEDALSIVAEQDYLLLTSVIDDPELLDGITNWSGYVSGRCRNPIRAFLDSGAGAAPMSGMSSVLRRRRAMEVTRRRLLEISQTDQPTDAQIVEVTNSRMRATRSNAERQGMICTLSDLYIQPSPLQILENDSVCAPQEDFLLHSSEGPVIVEAIIDEVSQQDEQLGVIADAWLGDLYGPDPSEQVRTVYEIAALLNLRPSVVKSAVEDIRQTAVLVVARMVGISSEDHHGSARSDL